MGRITRADRIAANLALDQLELIEWGKTLVSIRVRGSRVISRKIFFKNEFCAICVEPNSIWADRPDSFATHGFSKTCRKLINQCSAAIYKNWIMTSPTLDTLTRQLELQNHSQWEKRRPTEPSQAVRMGLRARSLCRETLRPQ